MTRYSQQMETLQVQRANSSLKLFMIMVENIVIIYVTLTYAS